MKQLILILLACLTTSTSIAQLNSGDGVNRQVPVDGKKLTVFTQGLENRKPGQPIVIFENGMGVTLSNFKMLFSEVSKSAPVLAYDRTGMGSSEKDGKLPTLKHHADRLKRLLSAMNIPPPYLIIGHSMGAVYARGYAIYYPDDLAGLIFLDPGDFTETREAFNEPLRDIGRTPQQIDAFTANRLSKPKVTSAADTTPVREREVLGELRWTDWKEISGSKLPAIPIQFIIGGKFGVAPEQRIKEFDHEAYFRARQGRAFQRYAKIAGESPYGKVFYSAGAGHFVHSDDPTMVISCIRIALEDYQRLRQEKK